LEGGKLRASYEQDLNRLKEAQKNAAVANLEQTRNQALSNLEAERASNTAAYNQQRSTANAQNRMNAKNFQEYLASTGRANSGLPAQARMQYDNNLQNSLNYLNAGEAGALADINRRSTLAHDAYNTGLAGANAQIEADYIKNLMNERDKEYQRQLQERQLQEQIRQFNENMALQRQQLYSRFSGGSGGGGSDDGTDYTFANSDGGSNNQSDAQKYGTFSNGYQPKGIGGYGALSKSGDTIKVNGKTQNIWKTPDGTRWYWDGANRQYVRIGSSSGIGHTGGGRRG